jgi:hypothetical protein
MLLFAASIPVASAGDAVPAPSAPVVASSEGPVALPAPASPTSGPVALPPPAAAPPPPGAAVPCATGPDALGRYRAMELEIRPVPFAQRRFDVYRGGARLDFGLFGDDGEEAFDGSPRAAKAFRAFHSERTLGYVGVGVGTGVMLVSVVALPTSIANGEDGTAPLLAFTGGLVVSAIGQALLQDSVVSLGEAVREYNDDLAIQLRFGPGAVGVGGSF